MTDLNPKTFGQKKVGFVRTILRAAMRFSTHFFPKNPTIMQTRFHGFYLLVWANEYIGRRILLTRSFEDIEMQQFPKLVQPGDVCFDVGANIGLHAINLAKAVGSTGRIFAFEPFRRNALLTALNCELNDLTNVVVVNSPLSAAKGKKMAANLRNNDSGLTFFSEDHSLNEMIFSETIDNYCSEHNIAIVNFMKLDVEGGELQVLIGASNLLSSYGKPRVVVVELVKDYLNRFGNTVEEACAFMSRHGYAAYVYRHGKLVNVTVDQIDSDNVFFVDKSTPFLFNERI